MCWRLRPRSCCIHSEKQIVDVNWAGKFAALNAPCRFHLSSMVNLRVDRVTFHSSSQGIGQCWSACMTEHRLYSAWIFALQNTNLQGRCRDHSCLGDWSLACGPILVFRRRSPLFLRYELVYWPDCIHVIGILDLWCELLHRVRRVHGNVAWSQLSDSKEVCHTIRRRGNVHAASDLVALVPDRCTLC